MIDFDDDNLDWEVDQQFCGYAHTTGHGRFVIFYEDTGISLSDHYLKSLEKPDELAYIINENGFAKELWSCLKDQLSLQSLRDLVGYLTEKMDEAEKEHKNNLKDIDTESRE